MTDDFDRLVARLTAKYPDITPGTAVALAVLSNPSLTQRVGFIPPPESYQPDKDAPEPAVHLHAIAGELFTVEYGDDDEVFLPHAVAEACRRNPGLRALVEKKYPGFRCARYVPRSWTLS